MALIRLAGAVGGISGSVGGVTYSHNRYGAYMRQRTKPVNPSTPRQTLARNSMATAVALWTDTLTAAQRAGWDTYAANVPVPNKLGDDVLLTGQAMFIRTNSLRIRSAASTILAAPAIFNLGVQDPTMSASLAVATTIMTLTFDDTLDWCSDDDAILTIAIGQPQNASRNFFGGPWQQVGAVPGVSLTPVTSPFASAPLVTDFSYAAGQKAWCRYRIAAGDGRLTEFFAKSTMTLT